MKTKAYRRGASPDAIALKEFRLSLELSREFNPAAVEATLETVRRRAAELIGAGCEPKPAPDFDLVTCDGVVSEATIEALNDALAKRGLVLTEFRPGDYSDSLLVLHPSDRPLDEAAVAAEVDGYGA